MPANKNNVVDFSFYQLEKENFEIDGFEFEIRAMTASEFKEVVNKTDKDNFAMADEVIKRCVILKETKQPIDLKKVSLPFYNKLSKKVVELFTELNGLEDLMSETKDDEEEVDKKKS
jgi:hypothetical protein